MFTDPTTGRVIEGIKEVKYSHEAMIDQLIANPTISQGELARHFGYTQTWISKILHSDAFQAKLQERKAELVDPAIRASVEERFKTVAALSLNKLIDRLADPTQVHGDEFLLKTAKLAGDALGYGARAPGSGGGQTNIAVVVQVPQKAASSAEWAAMHGQPSVGGGATALAISGPVGTSATGLVIDLQPKGN